jgi:dihydrofolate reductase
VRKIIVSNLQSLDGFMAGPNGEIDWFANLVDKEMEAYSIGLISTIDTMLFGRVTYELMAGYWPTAGPDTDDPRIISAMNNSSKVVFSRTLTSVNWRNARLVKGDMLQEVATLKQQRGKDMVIFGSGKVTSTLAQEGLIDDYRFFVVPVVLGKGKPQFDNPDRLQLRLVETKPFPNGVVLLRYQPAKSR